MSSEETPLLNGHNHNTVYDRFSKSEKRLIVGVVSWVGLLPRQWRSYLPPYARHALECFNVFLAVFVAGSFIPSIPQIALDLQTTASTVRWTLSHSSYNFNCAQTSSFAFQLGCQSLRLCGSDRQFELCHIFYFLSVTFHVHGVTSQKKLKHTFQMVVDQFISWHYRCCVQDPSG